MSEIDKRLAEHKARKAAISATGESELERWKAEMASAEAKLRQGFEQAAQEFSAKVRDAEGRLAPLFEAHEYLAANIEAESRRVAKLRRQIAVGAALLIIFLIGIAGLVWAAAAATIDEAQNEAARLRMENAQVIAQARAEGDADLAALSQRLQAREAAMLTEIDDMGADLAQLALERDEARADIEEFIQLKGQVGFDLIPYRDRIVIVVPEGADIRPWRVPGLSTLARYNGQMYQVFDQR